MVNKNILILVILIFSCYNGFAENVSKQILNEKDITILIEEWGQIRYYLYEEEYEDYWNIIKYYMAQLYNYIIRSLVHMSYINEGYNLDELVSEYWKIYNMETPEFIKEAFLRIEIRESGHKILFVILAGQMITYFSDEIDEILLSNRENITDDEWEKIAVPFLKNVERLNDLINIKDRKYIKKNRDELSVILQGFF
ncbi:hypothetical protein AGMMS49579_19840 [Spirochaetia bacterium]|nr:hypothetical protein AGMMS49579_19840 [Spirochaetia bacterium]